MEKHMNQTTLDLASIAGLPRADELEQINKSFASDVSGSFFDMIQGTSNAKAKTGKKVVALVEMFNCEYWKSMRKL